MASAVILPPNAGTPAQAGVPVRRTAKHLWLGLVPFVAFLVLFLLVPAFSVFRQALRDPDGSFGTRAFVEAIRGQNFEAFRFSITFSICAALIGVVFGTLIAYAAHSVTRPRAVKQIFTSFSGVAANMGGVPLAFMFLSLLGRQGILTKILDYFGWDLYAGDFGLGEVSGLVTIYSYFNIPLMILVILPAIEGSKSSWREACSSLGGNTFTYWRRVGLPVLMPSILGGFLLLFANSFSAYATAAQVTDNSKIVPLRIGFFLGGDVSIGEDAVGYALSAWMIIVMAIAMVLYWQLRRRSERWIR